MPTKEQCEQGMHTTDNQGLCWWCGKIVDQCLHNQYIGESLVLETESDTYYENAKALRPPKYTTHIGMNFQNRFADLFCLQLLNESGKAEASVSFTDGLITDIKTSPALALRTTALIKLAKIHYKKHRI